MSRPHAPRRERGAATIFVLGMSMVLMVCIGLVVDGGLGINARMRVADDAEQAARAATNAVDVARLRADGTVTIDPGLARQNAQSFLQGRGYGSSQFSVDVDGDSVSVEVRDRTETTMLKVVGIDSYPVAARATSTAATS